MDVTSSLIELLTLSPKFHELMKDFKRLAPHMTDAEKQHLVRLVKQAMVAPRGTGCPDCGTNGDHYCPSDVARS